MATQTIRIVSDGTGRGTKVFLPNGEPIPNIERIEIGPIAANTAVKVALHFTLAALDISAAAAASQE